MEVTGVDCRRGDGEYQYYIHSYVCLITLHSGMGVVCNILEVVGVVCSGFKCVTTTHSLLKNRMGGEGERHLSATSVTLK